MLLRAVLVLSALLAAARAAFVLADSYPVLCARSGAERATIDSRTFVGDATRPASVLLAHQSAAANASPGPANDC